MIAPLLLTLIITTISIIPNWNLKTISKDILTTTSTTYVITHREMYNLIGKLEKTIERATDGKITHKNKLNIINKNNNNSKE